MPGRPCSRCAACSRKSSRPVASRSTTIWRHAPRRRWRAMPGATRGSTCSPTRRRARRRSGPSRVAADARGFRAFRAEARRLFEALDRPFLHDTKTDPITLGWRMGARGFRDYLNLRAYGSMWHALGGYFRDPRLRQLFGRYATYCGSSPLRCPATLMLIAHVEASGVWLVEGGMHRLAGALEALARTQGRPLPLRQAGTRDRRRTGACGRRPSSPVASGSQASAVICNADPAAIADGRFGSAVRHAVSRVAPARRSLSAMVWTAHARATGFPLARHTVFFSDDYPPNSPHSPPAALPIDPASMSARRIATRATSPRPARNACKSSSTPRRPATARFPSQRSWINAHSGCWTASRGRGCRSTWGPRRC